MDTTTHASESVTPELTPQELSDLNGGYVYEADEYVPRTSDNEVGELPQAAADLLHTNPDVRDRFGRILATAGGATALAFLLAACGPNAEPAPTPSVDISSPTPTPIETPEIPQVAEYIPYPEPTPDTLVPYEQMSFADFEALPKQEQAPYVSWLTRNLDTLKAEWRNQRIDTPFDEVDVDISRDNSAQELTISQMWTLRIAASLKAEDARKVITFLIASKSESSKYGELIAIGDVPDRYPRAMAEALMFPMPQVTSETDLATNSNGVEFKDYTMIRGLTGEATTNTGYYHEYTDYTGQPYPVWLTKS